MSRHGVTYWNSAESTFTELDTWMEEFEQYTKLVKVSIPLHFNFFSLNFSLIFYLISKNLLR